MQYICDKYAPESSLYPKDPKQRALVNQRLCFNAMFYYSSIGAYAVNWSEYYQKLDINTNVECIFQICLFLVGADFLRLPTSADGPEETPYLIGYVRDIPKIHQLEICDRQ